MRLLIYTANLRTYTMLCRLQVLSRTVLPGSPHAPRCASISRACRVGQVQYLLTQRTHVDILWTVVVLRWVDQRGGSHDPLSMKHGRRFLVWLEAWGYTLLDFISSLPVIPTVMYKCTFETQIFDLIGKKGLNGRSWAPVPQRDRCAIRKARRFIASCTW